MSETQNIKETLGPVLRVLRDLGGKFVFSDEEGNAFVLMSKKDLVQKKVKEEQQLPLPPARAAVRAAVRQHAPELSDDIIEAINRDIALSHEEPEPSQDDLAFSGPAVPKLRFEPLKGDLSPDLQD